MTNGLFGEGIYLNKISLFCFLGEMVEYDDPATLMIKERSHFGELVKEYWSRSTNASSLTLDFP